MDNFIEITSKNIEYNLINLSHLVFEVTDACNLQCKYCGYAGLYEGYDKRENLKFPIHQAKLIIDYLHKLWKENHCSGVTHPFTISFYGGEPLLNMPFIKDVIDYVEQLETVGKKFHYGMTTNAMLLDKQMDYLVEKKFRLLISLDGDKEGQSYRIDMNGKNSFDRVFANIKLLQSNYPDYFKRFVMFNSVLHNKNGVESTFRFIKDTFGKEPAISPLNNSGIRADKVDEFYRTYRNMDESIKQATNCESLKNELFIKNPETGLLLNHIFYNSGNVFDDYNKLLLKKKELSSFPSGTCIPFSKKMFVTVKGKILQCERINHEFALGQVTDAGVELDMEQIAQQQNSYTFKYIKQCKSCAKRKACMQCVYQIDDIQDTSTTCHSYCSQKQQTKQQEQCMDYLDKNPTFYNRFLNEIVIRG